MAKKGFTTCLWFDGQAEEAANYYHSIFEDSKIGRIGHYTEAGPGTPGSSPSFSGRRRSSESVTRARSSPPGPSP